MIRHDHLTQQINAEVLWLMDALLIDPNLAMVIGLPGDRIISQQKTPHERCDSSHAQSPLHTRQTLPLEPVVPSVTSIHRKKGSRPEQPVAAA